MKAFLCRKFGPINSHTVDEVDNLVPGDNEVVVDVHAAGAVSYTHLTLPTTPYV